MTGMAGDTLGLQGIYPFKRKGQEKKGIKDGYIEPSGLIPFFYRRFQKEGYQISPDCFKK
jgi:hypothetical protein